MKEEEKRISIKQIFDNTNYWLAFGEAKNAGLLAADIAIIAVLFQLELNRWLYLLLLFILISIFITILGLWSRLSIKKKNKTHYNKRDNLMFFKDIAKYSEEDYCQKIYANYFKEHIKDIYEIPADIRDMLLEININAKITVRKFEIFNLAVKVNIISLIYACLLIIVA